ncbi:lipase family alpha/beta hydrolase [Algicola sagamiensis]|uniref:lipase family alpha/beta hydrolase n=1 Tax=Algicola sagamiensis TaxID=163869 RepID=UPI00037B7961|nr:triacylglycerol lipase [Algicola sagamiensis]
MKKSLSVLFGILALVCSSFGHADDYTQTKYPIVLVHGVFGFDSILGADYFYKIPYEIQRSAAGQKVFVASVSAANSHEVRGAQLAEYVEEVLAITQAEKVNLIGHSQGGPTSRYVASMYPEMIASVTTVGGVNWGSPVADVIRKIPTNSLPETVIAAVANGVGKLIRFLSGSSSELPIDSVNALNSLTTPGTLAFNQRYPEGVPERYCGEKQALAENNVYYFSWSGATEFTNVFDPIDYVFKVTGLAFNGEPNDGLVSACSSHLGYVINDSYDINHLDQINHSFGMSDLFETDPITIYRNHANRLKNYGL